VHLRSPVLNFFLEPSAAKPQLFAAAQSDGLLDWWPSYWFLGLFEAMNGWPMAAVNPMARRACAGLALAACGAASMFLLSYLRTIRKIVEEPDIVPGARGGVWLPPFGNAVNTAVVQFAIRSLLRSRQHRVILGFYMGIGFALVTMFARADIRGTPELGTIGMMALSLVIQCFAVAAVRLVITLPADLRANWVFRITAIAQPSEYAQATRRSVIVLSTLPVWLVAAASFFALCPWRVAAGHLAVLVVLGLALVDGSLIGFRKIPFTCSYLPGKAQFHLVFLAGFGLLFASFWFAQQEMEAMRSPWRYLALLTILGAAAVVARWRSAVSARDDEARVQFEDSMTPAVQTLGLRRDGVVPIR
jgi:hypothetical protein